MTRSRTSFRPRLSWGAGVPGFRWCSRLSMAVLAALALAACTQPGKVSVGIGTAAYVPQDAHPYAALYLPYAEMATLAYTDKQFLSRDGARRYCPDEDLAQFAGAGRRPASGRLQPKPGALARRAEPALAMPVRRHRSARLPARRQMRRRPAISGMAPQGLRRGGDRLPRHRRRRNRRLAVQSALVRRAAAVRPVRSDTAGNPRHYRRLYAPAAIPGASSPPAIRSAAAWRSTSPMPTAASTMSMASIPRR